MIIYTDIITGDEILSDTYGLKEIDNVAYECDCTMITVNPVEFDIGANASAEEKSEDLEDTSARVNDVIHSFRYQETSFDKKSYISHLKLYLKKLKEELAQKGESAETIQEFQQNASEFSKKILKKFDDFQFFTGESMNPDGMAILLNYREDGITPYVTVWKHGLREKKV